MRQRKRSIRSGFTLVELLVVIAIIALLIGVLVPALSRGREAARLALSMSNMRQITVAAVNYSHQNQDNWPMVPLEYFTGSGANKKFLPLGPNDLLQFNSWKYGGKTNDAYWQTHAPINDVPADRRPLNIYLYPDTDFGKIRWNKTGKNVELEIFRCPSDRESYQRGFWADEPSPTIEMSSYDDCGTSYHENVKWWYAFEDEYPDTQLRWSKTKSMFRRGGLGGPSKFVWLYDQTMDVVTHHDAVSQEGVHGGLNKAKAAYMDGHVVYVTVEPGKPVTESYWLMLK